MYSAVFLALPLKIPVRSTSFGAHGQLAQSAGSNTAGRKSFFSVEKKQKTFATQGLRSRLGCYCTFARAGHAIGPAALLGKRSGLRPVILDVSYAMAAAMAPLCALWIRNKFLMEFKTASERRLAGIGGLHRRARY